MYVSIKYMKTTGGEKPLGLSLSLQQWPGSWINLYNERFRIKLGLLSNIKTSRFSYCRRNDEFSVFHFNSTVLCSA
jgi:hypothetical protein